MSDAYQQLLAKHAELSEVKTQADLRRIQAELQPLKEQAYAESEDYRRIVDTRRQQFVEQRKTQERALEPFLKQAEEARLQAETRLGEAEHDVTRVPQLSKARMICPKCQRFDEENTMNGKAYCFYCQAFMVPRKGWRQRKQRTPAPKRRSV